MSETFEVQKSIDKNDTNSTIDDNIFENEPDGKSLDEKPVCVKKEDCKEKPWNYKILLLLRKIGKKTMGYRWMHEQESQYNEDMETKLTIYEIVILSLLGIVTCGEFVGFIIDLGLDNNRIIYIVLTSFQLLFLCVSGIIKGYKEANKFSTNQTDHNYAASKFGEINLNIQNQLSLNLSDRDRDKDFLKNIIKNFNDIMFLAPKIREEVKKKYLEEADENNIFNPITEDINTLQVVVIKDELEDEKKNDKLIDEINLKSKYQIDRWLQHF